jgi:hypothetical protein
VAGYGEGVKPSLEQLRPIWADYGGALLDVRVDDTTIDHWQRVTDAIRDGWPSSYSEDNEPLALPAAIADVLRRSTSRTCFWEIRLTPTVQANCHFFIEGEIEFDLDPRQILSASDLDAVCAFVQAVGRAVRRPVHVCEEGGPPWPQDDLRYDPIADEVVALP